MNEQTNKRMNECVTLSTSPPLSEAPFTHLKSEPFWLRMSNKICDQGIQQRLHSSCNASSSEHTGNQKTLPHANSVLCELLGPQHLRPVQKDSESQQPTKEGPSNPQHPRKCRRIYCSRRKARLALGILNQLYVLGPRCNFIWQKNRYFCLAEKT